MTKSIPVEETAVISSMLPKQVKASFKTKPVGELSPPIFTHLGDINITVYIDEEEGVFVATEDDIVPLHLWCIEQSMLDPALGPASMSQCICTTVNDYRYRNDPYSQIISVFEDSGLQALRSLGLDRPKSNKDTTNSQLVYLIENNNNHFKIGIAINPIQRLGELQCGSSTKLTLKMAMPGGFTKEQALHRKYKEIRLESEWFSYSLDIVNEFTQHKSCIYY